MPAGLAWAQTSDTRGTIDTRTPTQQKAHTVDDSAPAVPGESTRPGEMQAPSRDSSQGTPGAPGEAKGASDTGTSTSKKSTEGTESDTSVEKKSTSTSTSSSKHKRAKESQPQPMPSNEPEPKSKMNLAPDEGARPGMDTKSDLEGKDQLNSDK
jgi:hypothetical protein